MKREALILDCNRTYAAYLENELKTIDFFYKVTVFYNEQDLFEALSYATGSFEKYLFLEYYLNGTTLPDIYELIIKLSPNIKLIVISSITNPVLLKGLMTLKPDGIVHKTDRTYDIVKCIKRISIGAKYYTKSIEEILKPGKSRKIIFSKREIEIISFFARGYTVEQTGLSLGISPVTVVSHRRKMFKKISCHTIDELLNYVIQKKIIE